MIEVVPSVFRSSLPTAAKVRAFAEFGGKTVVDLTQRERPTVERACARFGVEYVKHPTAYVGDGADIDSATDAVLLAERPVMFHCFHGRDRTGLVARRVVMREVGCVYLYRVGRNLNRAVRTCEAFGIGRVVLVDCDESRVEGRLYGAHDRVTIERHDALPVGDWAVALETHGDHIDRAEWSAARAIVLGGETHSLPRSMRSFRIPTCGKVSGLTVEAALAIGLHAWRGSC